MAAGGGGGGGLSAENNKWCFSSQQLDDSPSRRGGLDRDKELACRQQAANLLQDMGQRINVYPSAGGESHTQASPGTRPQIERITGFTWD